MNNRALLALVLPLLALPISVAAQTPSSLFDLSLEELLQVEMEPVFGASRRLSR